MSSKKLNLSIGEESLLKFIANEQVKLFHEVKCCFLTFELIRKFVDDEFKKSEKLEKELEERMKYDFKLYNSIGSRFTILFEIKNTLLGYLNHYCTDEYLLQGHEEPKFVKDYKNGDFPGISITYKEIETKTGISEKTVKDLVKKLEERDILRKERESFGPYVFSITINEIIHEFKENIRHLYVPKIYYPWKIQKKEKLFGVFEEFMKMTTDEVEKLIKTFPKNYGNYRI